MFGILRHSPSFEITHETTPSGTLLAGFSAFGLAGLTAADYLVNHLELEERGHIRADGLPSITPFEKGRPRHATRLYSRDDLDVTVLVSEQFVPASAGEAFSGAVLDWTEENSVREVAVLSGIPIAHGPDEHSTFYIATDDYREHRLDDVDVKPMGTGFLDGVNAKFVERGLTSSLGVCVYVTPVHARVPDVDAAVNLVETVEAVYDLGIDPGPLHEFADQIREYYSDLAERMEQREADVPEDRMYM